MTYRHKRDACMKNSKEIVENILRMKSSDYEFLDQSEIATSRKVILFEKTIEGEANVLPSHSSDEMESALDEEENRQEDCVTIEDMESYQPCQEFHFEVSEVKDGIERKKKKRNYIEFRPDYSKIA